MTIALCLGGALSVWDDLAAAVELVAGRQFIIVATNFAGIEYEGRLDAWVTLHPEAFEQWRAERAERGWNTDYRAFVHARPSADAEALEQAGDGSSGMFAAQVALEVLGCDGAILCGVPLDPEGNHIKTPKEPWALAERYRPTVELAHAEGLPIRSMSGWTAEVLGRPSKRWISRKAAAGERVIPVEEEEPEMRIQMKHERNFTPPEDRRITMKYLEGQQYTVKRAWGEAMVADLDATEVDEPHRRDAT